MYGINPNEIKEPAYMVAGIHQNVSISNISKEETRTGKQILQFLFTAEDGSTFSHKEFPVILEDVADRIKGWQNAPSPQEQFDKEVNEMSARILHILSCFIPREQVSIPQTQGWEEFIDAVIELAGDLYKDQKYRIKVVYNSKDYTTFPTRTISPFIQNMEDADRLRINPKYDKVTLTVPDAESAGMFGDEDGDEDPDEMF